MLKMNSGKKLCYYSIALFCIITFGLMVACFGMDVHAQESNVINITNEMINNPTEPTYTWEGEGWKFDQSTKTLYLNNYTYNSNLSQKDLLQDTYDAVTINVTGNCTLNGGIYCKALHITGTGTLTITGTVEIRDKNFSCSFNLDSTVNADNSLVVDIPVHLKGATVGAYSVTGQKDKQILVDASTLCCLYLNNSQVHMCGLRPSLSPGNIVNSVVTADCTNIEDLDGSSFDLINSYYFAASSNKSIINSTIDLKCGPYSGIYNVSTIKDSAIRIISEGKVLNNRRYWGTGIECYGDSYNWSNSTFDLTVCGPSLVLFGSRYTISNCKINAVATLQASAILTAGPTINFNNCTITAKAGDDVMDLLYTKINFKNSKTTLTSEKANGLHMRSVSSNHYNYNITVNGGYLKTKGYIHGIYNQTPKSKVYVKAGYLEMYGKTSAITKYKLFPSGKKYRIKAGSSKKKAKKRTALNNKYKYIYIKKK